MKADGLALYHEKFFKLYIIYFACAELWNLLHIDNLSRAGEVRQALLSQMFPYRLQFRFLIIGNKDKLFTLSFVFHGQDNYCFAFAEYTG